MFFIDQLKQRVLKNKGIGVIKPDPKDDRDLKVGFLGFGDYEPKHDRKVLDTLSTRDQYPFNTCTYESAVVQAEPDENQKLSVRSAVVWAKDQGYISGNGWSTLRASQKTINKFGALPYGEITEDNRNRWGSFSEANFSERQKELASNNRSKTYWRIESLDEIYENIDKGRTVQIALRWRTSYNGNNLRSPYILPQGQGMYVGGHAVLVVGYDRNYKGKDVFILKNSYGEDYGQNGLFYMTEKHIKEQLDIFGGWCQLDYPTDVGKAIRNYDKMNVKVGGEPEIYKIQDGKKRLYSSWESFVKKGKGRGWENIDKEVLNKIPEGESITLNN